MTVQAINSGVATTSSTTAPSTGAITMGKDDFLKILMAQLKNQDPLKPQDPSQFVTELSQLSSVESLKNIETALAELKSATATSNTGQWVSAIGDYMQVSSTSISAGDRVSVTPSGAYDALTLTLKGRTDGSIKTVTFNSGDTPVYTNDGTTDYFIMGATAVKGGVSSACDFSVYRVIRGVQTSDAGTLLVAGDSATYSPSNIKLIFK
jgi:flagellar basal-body rod modification protein FlgD